MAIEAPSQNLVSGVVPARGRTARRPAWQHRRVPTRRRLGGRYQGLLVATGVSSLGDGIMGVALPLLAVSITHNALAISGVLIGFRLPWLGALPLGAIADRSDRRRMALNATVVQGALFLLTGLLIAAGVKSLPFVYVVALTTGTLEVVFTAATAAVVPDLVARDDLATANGRLEATRLAGDVLTGQAVGAVLFVAVAALPFLLDGASFAAAAVILFFVLPAHVRRARSSASSGTTLGQDVVAGATYLWTRPWLRRLTGTIGALAFFQAMVMGILVVFALGPLHLARSSYGLFLAVAAAGWVAGGFLAGRIDGRAGHARCLVLAAGAATLAYLVLAPAPSVVVAAAALFAEGFAVSLGNVASLSIRQERVPREMLGRINSAFRMVTYGAVPAGALVGGLLAQAWSLRGVILTAGVLQAAVLMVTLPGLIHALAEPEIDLRAEDLLDVSGF